MPFEITPAHAAIFDAVDAADRNIQIQAVAGAGKTTTLVQALGHIPSSQRVLMLAFNKRIADEMSRRVPQHVTARTLNSLGHGALGQYARSQGWPAPKLDVNKTRGILRDVIPSTTFASLSGPVGKLVRIAKSLGVIPRGARVPGMGLVQDEPSTWLDMVDRYDVDVPRGFTPNHLVAHARDALKESLRTTQVIDFDDQLWMTHAFMAPVQQHDWVCIDEAQDLSPLQHELVARAVLSSGRVIAVGDSCQAIYAFRGADATSMDTMLARFDMRELPLHVSYRCPQSIVALAQTVVPHIQPHASAPLGVVDTTSLKCFDDVDFQLGDMIVCRFNAPLVKVCFSLLRRRVPAVILGRDIGAGLISLVKRLEAISVDDLLGRLAAWENAETERFTREDKPEKIEAVQDKADAIRVFTAGASSVTDVIATVERLFADDRPEAVVTLATIHKAKGLEAPRVFLLDRDRMPSKFARKPWQMQQELNCIYIAYTRAREHLQFIQSGG